MSVGSEIYKILILFNLNDKNVHCLGHKLLSYIFISYNAIILYLQFLLN